MSYQMLVGLWVIDDQQYSEYRKAMKPILQNYGGYFGYDFKVGEMLCSETPDPINRVFTLCFKNTEIKNDFFSDPVYIEVKKKYFETSVSHTTLMADYVKDQINY